MKPPQLEFRLDLPLARFELSIDVATDARALGLFGPSGAGKTSALEVLAGWRKPRAGYLRIGERVLFDSNAGVDEPPERRRIGYVPQEALLFPHWDVRHNVLATGQLEGDVFDRCIGVLELGPLLERSPTTLSGGEARRVALARALCSEPALLLLDEPLATLDLALRRRVLDDLVRVRDAFGVPMIFVSHDPTEVQVLCDELVVLEPGRVAARGDPRTLLRAQAEPGLAFENVLTGRVTQSGGGSARVWIGDGLELSVPDTGLVAGASVVLGLDADDVLVSRAALVGISARNVLRGRIERIEHGAHAAQLEVALGETGMQRLLVGITPTSVRELGLERSRECWLVFKASSVRVLSALRGTAAADRAPRA